MKPERFPHAKYAYATRLIDKVGMPALQHIAAVEGEPVSKVIQRYWDARASVELASMLLKLRLEAIQSATLN